MKLETPTPQSEKRPAGIGLLWYWLTRPHPSIKDVAERRRAQLAASLTLVLALVNFIGGLAAAARTPESTMQVFGLPVLGSLIAYLIIRTRFFSFGSFLFVVSFCASAYLNILSDSRDIRISILFYVPLGLTIGSFLLSSWAIFLITGLNVGATVILLPALGITLPENIGGAVGLVTAFGIVLITLSNFRNSVERQRLSELQNANQELLDIQSNLENRVAARTTELEHRSMELADGTIALELANIRTQKRATQFQAIAQVGRAVTSIQSLEELLPFIAKVSSEQLGFYHIGIFLLDKEKAYAILSAANSEGGKRMLERGHRLQVGAVGIVGYVASVGRPRIALDTGADAVFFNNPDLPDTHSEMALPLNAGSEIIGVLDVQSEQPAAFVEEDIELLTILADQVSIAIQNARRFQETQEAIKESEATIRQYLRKEWKGVAEEAQSPGYRFSSAGLKPLDAAIVTPSVIRATQSGQTSMAQEKSERRMAVPIQLHGQVIGVMHLQSTSQKSWEKDVIDITQAIAERVALAVENARLLESSQAQATRERTIGEITSRIGASVNLRNVLQTAVEELGRVLPGSDVVIQLESGKDESN